MEYPGHISTKCISWLQNGVPRLCNALFSTLAALNVSILTLLITLVTITCITRLLSGRRYQALKERNYVPMLPYWLSIIGRASIFAWNPDVLFNRARYVEG